MLCPISAEEYDPLNASGRISMVDILVKSKKVLVSKTIFDIQNSPNYE